MSRVADAFVVEDASTVRESILRQNKRTKELRRFRPVRPGNLYRIPTPFNKEYFGKRSFDLFFGIFAAAIFFLMYPFIALGIKMS